MQLPGLFAGARRRLLLQLTAIGVVQALLAIAVALLVRSTFDHLMQPGAALPAGLLGASASGLLGAAAISAWLRWRERVDAERLGQDYARAVRLVLFDHLLRMPARVLQRRSKGAVMLRFIGDLTALRQWLSLGLARLTVAGVATLVVLCVLALLAWKFAFLVAAVLVLGGGLSLRSGVSLQQAVRSARRQRGRMANNIGEKASAMGVVQAFGQGRRERRRVERLSGALYDAMITRADRLGRLRALTEITTAVASAGVLLLGAMEVTAGRTTPGTVVAIMAVVGMLIPSLRDLGRVHEYWHGAQVSRDNLLRFLQSPGRLRQVARASRLQLDQGRIELREVSVKDSLACVSLCAEAGQRIAIVGANGAGKSTLLALVARLMDADRGRVLLDGQDVARCNLASIRRNVGIMSPDLPLLRGSVEKNIRYRLPRADEEQLRAVSVLCDLPQLFAELPDGKETKVAEGGSNLSQGQRARIALARALLGRPRILLLDEVDANLDPGASLLVERILETYPGTVLLVTHGSKLLSKVDRIWRLDGGRVSECGPTVDNPPETAAAHRRLTLAS